jgi:adenylate cyclase
VKRFLKDCGWALLVAALHTALFLSPWGEALEMRFLDLWFNLRGPVAPPEDVVVVAMDEGSYGAFNLPENQAWPRGLHAKLLRRLAEAGAREVVFDVLFSGDGPDAEADKEFVEAMNAVPTVIGADVGTLKVRQYSDSRTLLLPAEKFLAAAKCALIGMPEDGEHVRRFLIPLAFYSRDLIHDLSSLAAVASGSSKEPGSRDMIRYYGPKWSIPTCSYEQVLDVDKPVPATIFRDKIVFVGLNNQTELGPAQKDAYLTSYSRAGRTFGVEIHATATANLLHGDWIRRAPTRKEACVLGLLAGLLTLGLLYLRPTLGAILVVGYGASWGVLAYWSFLRGQFLPGAVLAAIVLPVTYLKATLTNYIIARLQQLRLERAFRLYLSPEMAREVARNPEALQLGGQEVECTAMFTDIAGFTTIAEKMKPNEVSQMLNAYFTEVMEAIFEKRGTVIQFIGDGIYALWGAPAKTDEHARLCCEAAQAIRGEIERFNQSGRFPPLHTRFGINTGPVLVGNLGSKRRFDFTGIGDTVNLASRMEGLNKYFGTTILITDATRAQLPPEVVSLKMGLICAVGKTLPVGLHTLFRVPVSEPVAAKWKEGWERFAARDWDAAKILFSTVAEEESRLAKAVKLYHDQITDHRVSPPPDEWRGEIVFSTK